MHTQQRWWQRPGTHCALLAIVVFLAIAPTLRWLEFSGGMENVNVVTAREILQKNDAKTWLLPTMNGEPRTRKPPISHWATALGLMTSRNIEWGARWPSLLASCLTLAAVYALAKTVGDRQLALTSAVICASSLLFLQYARQAQYDVYLALWVVLANLFLAKVIFEAKWWTGCAGAGLCIGLALMTKGPPALVQTIVPVGLFAGWWAWQKNRPRLVFAAPVSAGPVLSYGPQRVAAVPVGDLHERPPLSTGGRLMAIALGVAVMLVVALPWPLYVASQVPGSWKLWKVESSVGVEARYDTRSKWYDYIIALRYLFPWIIWFCWGCGIVAADAIRQRGRKMVYMLALVFIPAVIMSFFAVRRNRYLLPMLGPMAIIAARAVVEQVRGWRATGAAARIVVVLHWAMLGAVAIGFPLVAAMGWAKLRTVDGAPWLTPGIAIVAGLGMAVAIAVGTVGMLRRPSALAWATLAVLLIWQAVFVWGYKDSLDGRSAKPLADRILQAYPDALVYNAHPTGKSAPLDLSVYLNRPVRDQRMGFAASPRPQVILLPLRELADTLPANCVYFTQFRQGSTRSYAYVLPPNTAPAPPQRDPLTVGTLPKGIKKKPPAKSTNAVAPKRPTSR